MYGVVFDPYEKEIQALKYFQGDNKIWYSFLRICGWMTIAEELQKINGYDTEKAVDEVKN